MKRDGTVAQVEVDGGVMRVRRAMADFDAETARTFTIKLFRGMGMKDEAIARFMRCSVRTVRRYAKLDSPDLAELMGACPR